MKRTPMNPGSGFKSKAPARREARQWTAQELPGPRVPLPQSLRVDDGKARMSVPIPKRAYFRSPALLKACRDIPCQHCGTSDGTVVAAHSNSAIHGKGRGIKASDQFVAALCHACHHDLDQGPFLSRAGRVAMWNAAHAKTIALLKSLGKWPDDIPFPQEDAT